MWMWIYFLPEYLTGIDTGKALVEEIRKEKEREKESQTLLLEPLLALTGSLTMSKSETVSNIHKCDIPTQLYLSGKLGIPEAILWLYGSAENDNWLWKKYNWWESSWPGESWFLVSLKVINAISNVDWQNTGSMLVRLRGAGNT